MALVVRSFGARNCIDMLAAHHPQIKPIGLLMPSLTPHVTKATGQAVLMRAGLV